jgi:uncharacterized protein YndB with AHSA1/START domain
MPPTALHGSSHKVRIMSSDLYVLSQTTAPGRKWASGCYLTVSMNNSNSIQSTFDKRPRGLSGPDLAGESDPRSWTVTLERSVAADTRRIFCALTVPEYLEAWICVPGHHPECSNVMSRNAHGFQIEHHCSSGATTKISGTYCSFLKRKLSFSWKPAHGSAGGESFVDIRLHGDFERSILRLRHFGLDSEDDFNWHLAFWSSSIARLCKLFDRPTAGADPRRPRAGRRRSPLYCEL